MDSIGRPLYPWAPFFDQEHSDKEAFHPCSVQEKPARFQHHSRWNATNSWGSFSVSWYEMSNTSRIAANRPRLKGDETLVGCQQGGSSNQRETGSFVAHMVSWAWSWHTLLAILHNSHASGRRSMRIVIFQIWVYVVLHRRENNGPKKGRVEINKVHESRLCEITERRGEKGKKKVTPAGRICTWPTLMLLTCCDCCNWWCWYASSAFCHSGTNKLDRRSRGERRDEWC